MYAIPPNYFSADAVLSRLIRLINSCTRTVHTYDLCTLCPLSLLYQKIDEYTVTIYFDTKNVISYNLEAIIIHILSS